MAERRYSEEEVSKIFERAAESQQDTRRPVAPTEGMTLTDLQEIGRDVGISPTLVAEAARSLDRTTPGLSRTLLGLPIGVGRTVELERRLSEADWERLVVDLRETFDARGRVRSEGNFKQWTNGNLQALVEPTETGDRVRLKTTKGNARALIFTGLGLLGAAAVTFVTGALRDATNSDALRSVWFLAVTGFVMLGIPAVQLPGWARLRRQQMEGIVARLALNAPPEERLK